MHAGIYPEVPDDFGHWLAGFIDGEGCFRIVRHNTNRVYACQFAITLRDDDLPLLAECAETTGLGAVHRQTRVYREIDGKPQATWAAFTRKDCARLVEILDQHALRSKKRGDYLLWREGVGIWQTIRRGGAALYGSNAAAWQRLGELRIAIMEGRAYHGSPAPIPEVVELDPVPDQLELVGKPRVNLGHMLPVPLRED